jgi:hypothetical protein
MPCRHRRIICRKDGSYILYNFGGGFSWYLFGPDNRLQHDIAGALRNGSWGYIVGTSTRRAAACQRWCGRMPDALRASVWDAQQGRRYSMACV